MQAESTLKLTLREAIRYRGLWGQWSWIAHRLSGLAVLAFLIIHVWDTANATFWPEAYSYTVEVFKWFPFSVMEIGLMAAVLYHAVNGIRITLLDFKPEWWKYQRQSAIAVWGLFFVVFIPIAFFMFSVHSTTVVNYRPPAIVALPSRRPDQKSLIIDLNHLRNLHNDNYSSYKTPK